MKLLSLTAGLFFLAVPMANADPAYINEDGYITITGEIDYVSSASDTFTLLYDGDDIEVSMDDIDEETLEQLIESEIIDSGSYVSVTGEMEDGVSGPVINASSINVYSDNSNTRY